MNVRVAAQPIGWSNDDFQDLGADIPLERCLSEMREAGYAGTELGHKFPREAGALKALLGRFGLELASAWHSTYLLSKPYADEERGFLAHARLLKALGSRTVIVAECTGRTYEQRGGALRWNGADNGLSAAEWQDLAERLDRLAEAAAREGQRVAYHHHMGTLVQREDEVDRLLSLTRGLALVFDTGHLACAGADPARALGRWAGRVAHVHLKNVRPAVLAEARSARRSFEDAVRAGVFTVPGDGGLEYRPILAGLEKAGYAGWLVVEAEQDPARANPFEYARRAREHLRSLGI